MACSGAWVAGVDGCRGGWLAALLPGDDAPVEFRLYPRFADVLFVRTGVIALDMPIGLPDRASAGGRECDRAARRLLGRRAASVFSPPARPALEAKEYGQAAALNGRGLSRQAFNIVPKIREVDAIMTPQLQETVFEAHPELAFFRLAGGPLVFGKKTREGITERERLLRSVLGDRLDHPETVRRHLGRQAVAADDALDACALALTARRIVAGQGTRLPTSGPEQDAKGLRMEIWY